jgi:hypothetical protein
LSYVQRYKKDGCATVKDVDFSKILSVAKVKVPTMVTSTFGKKVAGAAKPFDVIIEVDPDNGKSRLLIKKLASGDAIIEWVDPTVATSQGGVIKVKAAITSWNITKETYARELKEVVVKVNAQKDLIKALESNPGDPTAVVRIATVKDALEKAEVEGQGIFGKFDSWYLAGPRKGTGPLLVANKVDETKIDKADKDAFTTAVMEISQAGNEVKNTWTVGIAGAVKALLVRLDNLNSQITKTHGAAVLDIRRNFSTEIEALKVEAARMLVSLKLDHSVAQGEEFAARKGDSFDRLKDHANLISATIEGNNTRLKSAETNLAQVEKTASRLVKGIPEAFQRDSEIIKLNQQLIKLVDDQKKAIADAKVALTQANTKLDNFLKGH